jgi:hypothetical protein
MVEEETNINNTMPEEILFVDGEWKISKNTARAINDLLEPLRNYWDITYFVEWSPGKPLNLSVIFQSKEHNIYKARWNKPLAVIQHLLDQMNG